jgi:hypothetical protein
MAFPVQWRGRLLHLHLDTGPRQIKVALETGDELTLAVVDGPSCLARGGQRFVLRGNRSGWSNWEEVKQ